MTLKPATDSSPSTPGEPIRLRIRLPGGVVQGLTQDPVTTQSANVHQLGVAP